MRRNRQVFFSRVFITGLKKKFCTARPRLRFDDAYSSCCFLVQTISSLSLRLQPMFIEREYGQLIRYVPGYPRTHHMIHRIVSTIQNANHYRSFSSNFSIKFSVFTSFLRPSQCDSNITALQQSRLNKKLIHFQCFYHDIPEYYTPTVVLNLCERKWSIKTYYLI